MENPACHCCRCGQKQLSTSQLQHNPHQHLLHQHVSLPTRFGEVCGQQRVSGAEQWGDPWLPLALPQHSPVRSVVLWGALRGCRRVCRAPLPCAVPLVPAARAALGCLYTTHPAARLVRDQSLHHVQAVGLCPPVQAERGEAAYRVLLTSNELSLLYPATEGTSPASATDPSVPPVLSSSPANGDTGPTGHSAYLYQGLTCVPGASTPLRWG